METVESTEGTGHQLASVEDQLLASQVAEAIEAINQKTLAICGTCKDHCDSRIKSEGTVSHMQLCEQYGEFAGMELAKAFLPKVVEEGLGDTEKSTPLIAAYHAIEGGVALDDKTKQFLGDNNDLYKKLASEIMKTAEKYPKIEEIIRTIGVTIPTITMLAGAKGNVQTDMEFF